MSFEIETDLEFDGRWIAEINAIPGAMVYGATKEEAIQKVQALALRVLAEQLDHDETSSFVNVSFSAA